ncbi:MAG: anti-sigma factor family protein [Gemmatimonas sp.]
MSDLKLPLSCEQFGTHVSALIDGDLSPADRAVMEMHASECTECTALVEELRGIVTGAAKLPPLTPSRDLWQGIADRLDTPVLSIGSANATPVKRARTVSYRVFAAAAAALVAVSSGATYLTTRAGTTSNAPATTTAAIAAPQPVTSSPAVAPATPATPAPQVASANTAVEPPAAIARTASGETEVPMRARNVSRVGNQVEIAYEREITAMRRIVDERLGDLDSVTVVEIERNLRIIDKAINDSRRALRNDPRSRFLSEQLDRALENKLDIMRRIALL